MKRTHSYALILACSVPLLSSCVVKRWFEPAPAPVTTSSPAAGTREEIMLSSVNAFRATKGKEPLTRDPNLDAIARDHSVYMMRHRSKGLVNHDGYAGRVREVQQKYGFRYVFENAGAGSGKNAVVGIVDYWSNSSQHRSSMLGKWEATGIGVVVDADGMVFATEIFCGR